VNILYVVQHFAGPSAAGSSRAFENARRLVLRGHAVTMLCGRLDRSTERDVTEAREAGIDLRMAPILYSQKMSYPRRLVVFRRYMGWAVRAGKRLARPDVVLASSTPLTVGEIGRRIAAYHRIPFIFEVRDLWPEVPVSLGALPFPPLRWMARRMAGRVYAASDHVVALSSDMARVIRTWGVAPERISVIPNSSDTLMFGSEEAASGRAATRERLGWGDKFVCIHPGAMGLVNGLDYVLDAAKQLDRDHGGEILLALMGDGNQRARLASRIAAEGIRSAVLYPSVPKREMPRVLAASDVGLVTVAPRPYLEMNSANKFFDFLAARLPVLVNYGGWQAEVLRREGAGAATDPARPESLADALRGLRDDRAALAAMGRAARRLAEERYDRDALVAELETTLAGVVGRRSGVPVRAGEALLPSPRD
jgi:glycosyltransferase involved in cell wall biosynthesis